MTWALYSLLQSFLRAVFIKINRYYPGDPQVKSFWQAAFSLIVMLLALPFMHWPADPKFYLAAAIVGLILTTGNLIQLALAAQHKARVNVISMPIETAAAFVIWLIVSPDAWILLSSNMQHLGGVALAFAGAWVALYALRPHDISLKSIILAAPVGISFGIAGVATKLVMPETGPVLAAALAFTFVNFFARTVGLGLFLWSHGKLSPALPDKAMIRYGALGGLCAAFCYVAFTAGLALAPNPGYVSFMVLLLPVWMFGLNKILKVEEHASPGAAFLIFGSILVLILANLF